MFTRRLSLLGALLVLLPCLNAGAQDVTDTPNDLRWDISTRQVQLAAELFGPGSDITLNYQSRLEARRISIGRDINNSPMSITLTALAGNAQVLDPDRNPPRTEGEHLRYFYYANRADITVELPAAYSGLSAASSPHFVESVAAGSMIGTINNDTGIRDGMQVFLANQPGTNGTSVRMNVNSGIFQKGDSYTILLNGFRNLRELRAGDSIRVTPNIGWPVFGDVFDSFVHYQPIVDGEDGNTITSDTLLSVVDAVQLVATAPAERFAPVNPDDNTRVIDDFVVTIMDSGNEFQAIELGSLGINLNDEVRSADGLTPFGLTDTDTLRIRIHAPSGFDALGDAYGIIDLNDDRVVDTNEVIQFTPTSRDPNDNGAALISRTGTSSVAEALLAGPSKVYLVLDSEQEQEQGEYFTSLELVYGESTYLQEPAASTSTESVEIITDITVTRDVQFRLNVAGRKLARERFRDGLASLPEGQTVTLRTLILSGVSKGATAMLEYRLEDGLQFGEGLTDDSLTLMKASADSTSEATATLMSGGQTGDDRAVFQVTTGTAPTDDDEQSFALGGGDELVLTLPELQYTGVPENGAEFGVQVSVTPQTLGEFSFQALNPLTDGEDGNSIVNAVLVEVVDQFVLSATPPASLSARLNSDMPARFDDGQSVEITDGSDNTRQAVALGSLRITATTPTATLGSSIAPLTTPLTLTADDMLTLTVSGSRLGDYQQAFIALNDGTQVENNENIELPAGVMTTPGNGATATALLSGARQVYLVADGTTELIPGRYSVTLELDYANDELQDERIRTDVVTVLRPGFVENDAAFSLETTPRLLALEIFGERTEQLELPGEQQVVLTVMETTGVTRGASAMFEYRLDDSLQFGGRALRSSDLLLMRGADNITSDALPELVSGGQPGDDNVVFRVITGEPGEINDLALAGNDRLVLLIPGLQTPGGLKEGAALGVQLVMQPLAITGGFNFPVLNPLEQEDEQNVLVRVGRQFLPSGEGAGAMGAATMPMVSLNERTTFTSGALPFSLSGGGTGQAVNLGRLGVTKSATTYKGADGVTDFALTEDDRLLVTLSGDSFPAGAFAFIDLDGNLSLDTDEAVSLDTGLAIPGRGAGADALLAESRAVYLVTDGEAMLEIAGYSAGLMLDFADATYLDTQVVRTPTVTLLFEDVLQQGFAYAIPNCTQVERGHIHLVNETNLPLSLFISARDQLGAELGTVELDASLLRGSGLRELQPNEALDLLTEQVEQLFNLNDGGFMQGNRCTAQDTWAGRAQLVFLANGNLTIVPQIRGSQGELRDIGGFSGLSIGEERVRR